MYVLPTAGPRGIAIRDRIMQWACVDALADAEASFHDVALVGSTTTRSLLAFSAALSQRDRAELSVGMVHRWTSLIQSEGKEEAASDIVRKYLTFAQVQADTAPIDLKMLDRKWMQALRQHIKKEMRKEWKLNQNDSAILDCTAECKPWILSTSIVFGSKAKLCGYSHSIADGRAPATLVSRVSLFDWRGLATATDWTSGDGQPELTACNVAELCTRFLSACPEILADV